MKRLTMWYDGNHAICENEECSLSRCPFADPVCEQTQSIIDRLAAYEETGLEPEEIRNQLESMLDAVALYFETTPDRLRELAQADREGRCVVFQPGYAVVSIYNPADEDGLYTMKVAGVITKEEYEAALRREQE